jgi:hypothetical protein
MPEPPSRMLATNGAHGIHTAKISSNAADRILKLSAAVSRRCQLRCALTACQAISYSRDFGVLLVFLRMLAEREGFEPGRRRNEISKLLVISGMSSPAIPSKPRIWHWIWHLHHRAPIAGVAKSQDGQTAENHCGAVHSYRRFLRRGRQVASCSQALFVPLRNPDLAQPKQRTRHGNQSTAEERNARAF